MEKPTSKEIQHLDKSLKEIFISRAQDMGIQGEELETFKRAYGLWNSRALGYAKHIIAGRTLEEITPEETRAGVDAIKEFMENDLDRIEAILEAPKGKRRQDMLERLRALPALKTGAEWTSALSDFSECLEGDGATADAFLTFVEERTGTKVRDWLQLTGLTGIGPFVGYKELGTGAIVGASLRAQPFFFDAVDYRYQRALEGVLNDGGKYKDLLALDPEAFGITQETIGWGGLKDEKRDEKKLKKEKEHYIPPQATRTLTRFGTGIKSEMLPPWLSEAEWTKETKALSSWFDYKEYYKRATIRTVLFYWAGFQENSMARPALRTVAEKLEAPFYEVWLTSHMKIVHGGKWKI